MAKPSVWTNEKFILCAQELGIDLPHLIGHLESLWHAAYEHCGRAGTLPASVVEQWARWCGEPVKLLSSCLTKKILKQVKANRVQIPNYWQHIPDYVHKRIERKELAKDKQRTSSGQMADKRRQTDAERRTNGGPLTLPSPPLSSLETRENTVGTQTPTRKRGSRKPEGDPRIKDFLEYAISQTLEIIGVPLVVTWGKDSARVKSLLATFDLDKLKALWHLFLENDRFRTFAKDVSVFSSGAIINGLNQLEKSQPKKQTFEERMAEDYAETRRIIEERDRYRTPEDAVREDEEFIEKMRVKYSKAGANAKQSTGRP